VEEEGGGREGGEGREEAGHESALFLEGVGGGVGG
jgi:hypothetical protein